MESDDFFESKQRYYGKPLKKKFHDNYRYSHESLKKHNEHLKWLRVLDKIRNNKKLRLIFLVGFILILAIVIILIIVLFPLIIKLINYISQNGLQGILDGITGFLSKIWNGTGK